MAIQVTQKVEINKPRDIVANYAFETDNDPLWLRHVFESHLLTDRPIRKGTHILRSAKFLGKEVNSTLEIIDFEPGHKMVLISNDPFKMKVTVKFDDAGEGKTLAQIKVENESRKFYNLADILLKPQFKKNLNNSLKRLKLIMEENLL
ncbi:MAG: hypothetical protein EHM58_00840 [Ignavibacteriae bacterium]|nr:MAG: hypothetical protein EHM58_00840 [Ignavibacteriota bacterium]